MNLTPSLQTPHTAVQNESCVASALYYPKREGMRQEGETISFPDFMYQLLFTYREMHRLHQLIKCLLNYLYLAPPLTKAS